MCTGRVDLAHVFRAFSKGVDGVFIGGCRFNECNYTTHGNFDALNMALLSRRILEHSGLHPDRLNIEFMSSADGNLFAEYVNKFGSQLRELGPLGKAEGLEHDELSSKLAEIRKLVPYIKTTKKKKLASRLESPEEFDQLFTLDEIDRLFSEVISYYIDPDKCLACLICARRCPVDAITGGKNQIHVINQELCIKCGVCVEVCPSKFDAVKVLTGEPAPSPISEEARTIVR